MFLSSLKEVFDKVTPACAILRHPALAARGRYGYTTYLEAEPTAYTQCWVCNCRNADKDCSIAALEDETFAEMRSLRQNSSHSCVPSTLRHDSHTEDAMQWLDLAPTDTV
jgi:hypothetical protein